MSFRFLIFILLVAAVIYYFNEDLRNFYFNSSIDEGTIINIPAPEPIVEIPQEPKEMVKSVSAPSPLRVRKEIPEALLTEIGTFTWTNTQRIMEGLSPLRENAQLKAAALSKAKDIFQNQYFSHVSPAGEGPAEIIGKTGYEYISVGENMALGNFLNDGDLVRAWMESPGHRANILNPGYEELGAAVLKGLYNGETVWIGVQEFGRPLSSCPAIDENLKNNIETVEAEIKNLALLLEEKRIEIEKMNPRTPAFRREMDYYNSLVARHNALIDEIKSMVAIYNNQVVFFNQCLNE